MKKIETHCKYVCSALNTGCKGDAKLVKITKQGEPDDIAFYCDNAIEMDKKNGFSIEVLLQPPKL